MKINQKKNNKKVKKLQTKRKMKLRIGQIQRKLILILQQGGLLCMRHSVGQKYRIVEKLSREWAETKKSNLEQSIATLERQQLVSIKKKKGVFYPLLTARGRRLAREYQIDHMQIDTQVKWDHKWRVVIFDIPLEHGAARSSLRYQLQRLGFYMLQQSVWIHPHPCFTIIDYLIDFYGVAGYLRFIVAESIDNEESLIKDVFKDLLTASQK